MADGHTPPDPLALTLAKGVEIEADRIVAATDQEKAVIGRLLVEPQCLARVGALAPEHFAVDQFRRAYTAMLSLKASTGSFTVRSVHERSGVDYKALMVCASGYVPLMCFDDYVREIRQSAVVRSMMAEAKRATSNGIGAPPEVIANMLRKAATDLGGVSEKDDMTDAKGLAEAVFQHVSVMGSGQRPGISTGMLELDAMIGGYRPGELVILAARPGMGKTVFAVSSARQCAEDNRYTVGFFSLEIGREQTAARFMADQARALGRVLPYSWIVTGDIRPGTDEIICDAGDAVSALGLFVTCEPGIPLATVDAKIEDLQARSDGMGRKLAVVFIDYLKFLKAADRYKGNRVLEIGEITGGLKEIAKKRGVCIVLLTQLNRGVESREDKRPTLMDLRDSGEIEQDADIVMFIYREAYYLRNPTGPDQQHRLDEVRNDMEILVEKNRAGECGTVKLWCDVATCSVRDMGARR